MSQIKNRLKAAYENVEFYASTTWVHSSQEYQKANQELYVREIKVRDALTDDRPRTVRDSIPQSKLAKYSNYEYNESRELCYAPGGSQVSFYYPCVCRRNSLKEPWMLPEVEQLYVWFSYAPNFNILDFLRLEELGHLDEQDKLGSEALSDFHKVYPVLYEILDRAPGKPRYTSSSPISESDLLKYVPTELKIQTFEDMILRLKIKSDKVRYLWSNHSRPKSEVLIKNDKMDLVKSPLGNYFLVNEPADNLNIHSHRCYRSRGQLLATDDHLIETQDFGQLQDLADSLRTLESFACNSIKKTEKSYTEKSFCDYEIPEAAPKTEAAPTRRLYSAVLQGVTTQNKASSCTDIISCACSSMKDQTLCTTSTTLKPASPTAISTETSVVTVITPIQRLGTTRKNITPCIEQSNQWTAQPFCWSASNQQLKNYAQVNQEQIKSTSMQVNFSPLMPPRSQKVETSNIPFKLSNTAITTSYSDVCSSNTINFNTFNVPCPLPNNTSNVPVFISNNNTYLGNTYVTNTPCLNNNIYSNNPFNNNAFHTHFHAQYPVTFQNNSYTPTSFTNTLYNTNTYQNNQMCVNPRSVFPQFNRQPYPSTQVPPPSWFVQQSRPSSTLYSVAHFAAQPYLFLASAASPPPPLPPASTALSSRQNQRCHYIRPPPTTSLQPLHVPLTTQQTTTTLASPQNWGMQSQNLFRANSTQQLSTPSQQQIDNVSSQNPRFKLKSKKCLPASQVNVMLQARSKSPEGSTHPNENLKNVDIISGSYSNASMTNSKRSIGSSDVARSITPPEKPLLVKQAVSTSSIECRRTALCNDYKDVETSHIEKACSTEVVAIQNEATCFFSSISDGSRTILPISSTISEELERLALEQYQSSEDNFYQELERQAKEQYDDDRSENWKSPPKISLFFGGHKIHSIAIF